MPKDTPKTKKGKRGKKGKNKIEGYLPKMENLFADAGEVYWVYNETKVVFLMKTTTWETRSLTPDLKVTWAYFQEVAANLELKALKQLATNFRQAKFTKQDMVKSTLEKLLGCFSSPVGENFNGTNFDTYFLTPLRTLLSNNTNEPTRGVLAPIGEGVSQHDVNFLMALNAVAGLYFHGSGSILGFILWVFIETCLAMISMMIRGYEKKRGANQEDDDYDPDLDRHLRGDG